MENYNQPFCNIHLNSLINRKVISEIKKFTKIDINSNKSSQMCQKTYSKYIKLRETEGEYNCYFNDELSETSSLYLIDDDKLIIDGGNALVAVNIKKMKVIGRHPKDPSSFVVIGEPKKNIYFFLEGILHTVNYNSFLDGIEMIKISFCEMRGKVVLLTVDENNMSFISGCNDHNPATWFFNLKCDMYNNVINNKSKWDFYLRGDVIMPPVSVDAKYVIPHFNDITIVNNEGKLIKEFEIQHKSFFSKLFSNEYCTPLWASIGSDNLIYLLYNISESDESMSSLRVLDFDGNVKWEHKIFCVKPNQPPIVSKDSSVYITGPDGIEAFSDGKRLWLYPLMNNPHSQLATVTGEGNILVSDYNRVINLNQEGKVVWIYEDKNMEAFVTQPIIDSKGRVFVATNKEVVVLE